MIAATMVRLFAAIMAGFILRKRNVLSDASNKTMSELILKLTMPALVLAAVGSLDRAEASLQPNDVLLLVAAGFIFYIVFTLIAWLFTKLLRTPIDLQGSTMLCFVLSNTMFMGFPVAEAFLGSEAVFYTMAFHLPTNLWFFTVGTWLVEKDSNPGQPIRWKNLLSPGMIISILAVALYFSGIRLPEVAQDTLAFVGDLTPALSLIVIGSGLAAYPLKTLFSTPRLYLISFIRLMILPAIALVFIQFFSDSPIAIQTVVLSVSMPVASTVAMGTAKYPKQGTFASSAVGLSTILSMASIPLWFYLLKLWQSFQ